MKMKFKTKKLFASMLAVVLSAVLFMMSASAMYMASGTFSQYEISAYDFVSISSDQEIVYVAVDFDYIEEDLPVTEMEVGISVEVRYHYGPSGNPVYTDGDWTYGSVFPHETEDSDEVYVMLDYRTGFSRVVVTAIIEYTLIFTNGSYTTYEVSYYCEYDGSGDSINDEDTFVRLVQGIYR